MFNHVKKAKINDGKMKSIEGKIDLVPYHPGVVDEAAQVGFSRYGYVDRRRLRSSDPDNRNRINRRSHSKSLNQEPSAKQSSKQTRVGSTREETVPSSILVTMTKPLKRGS